jgi:DnaJ family protein A protein 2
MNEGMPRYRNPFSKGNLYIKFNIGFPPSNFADEKHLKVGSLLMQSSSALCPDFLHSMNVHDAGWNILDVILCVHFLEVLSLK